jgi:UDP-glucose 4-epimerase
MKALVTGGAGYIGGTVAAQLASLGHRVVILDDFSHSNRKHAPRGIELIEGSVLDRPLLDRTFEAARRSAEPFDCVLHFAAFIEVGDSMKRPEIYFENNTCGSFSLLQAMLAAGPRRIVFSSTAAVYGDPESVPIREDARIAPTSVYGESKVMVERALEWLNRIHGLRYASLRYFNVAGAPEEEGGVLRGEAHEPETHLIPLVLDVALGRRPSIRIYGDDYPTPDGTCIRDYIHVTDLAGAHIAALEALDSHDRIVCNLGNGRGFSVREIVEAARRVTGHPIPVEVQRRRAGDPAVLVASSERAKSLLGWEPRYTDLDAIIRTAWEWHQKRYIA